MPSIIFYSCFVFYHFFPNTKNKALSLGVNYLIKCDARIISYGNTPFLPFFYRTVPFCIWRSLFSFFLSFFRLSFTQSTLSWLLLLHTSVYSCGIMAQWLDDIYGLQVIIIFHSWTFRCFSFFSSSFFLLPSYLMLNHLFSLYLSHSLPSFWCWFFPYFCLHWTLVSCAQFAIFLLLTEARWLSQQQAAALNEKMNSDIIATYEKKKWTSLLAFFEESLRN